MDIPVFQSTHPVRGATAKYSKIYKFLLIFSKKGIHYFLAELPRVVKFLANQWQTK